MLPPRQSNETTVDEATIDVSVNEPSEPEAIDEVVARVLRRAHQTAENGRTPGDARVILHMAHSFADELSATNPRFDRAGFIKAATNGGRR
jgi:hypothetical protein